MTLIDREGNTEELGLMSKYEVGQRILDRVVGLLEERGPNKGKHANYKCSTRQC